MPILDIFTGDAFSSVTLAEAIEHTGYVPNRMSELNLFMEEGITTEGIAIETRKTGELTLVPVTPRGAPLPQQTHTKRNLRSFQTTRIGQGDRLLASELDFVRRFGETEATEMAQAEIARRLGTSTNQEGLLNNIGLTFEFMMLQMVKTAQFVDASGNVLVDWGQELRSPEDVANSVPFVLPVETFNFSTLANGALREKLNGVARSMQRGSKGKFIRGQTKIHVLVGDEFFDALGKNAEIRNHYSRQSMASYVAGNDEWDTIEYANFVFENYRGTDDQSTVDIELDEGHAFPTDTRGCFKHYMSHGEDFESLGTRGRKYYVDVLPDLVKDRYVDMEVITYPLLACTQPQVLRKFELV